MVALVIHASIASADFTFGEPVNLGPKVNSTTEELSPCVSCDGLELYFAPYREGGSGGCDLWVSTRRSVEDDWGMPRNLGPLVNSPYSDLSPSISADGLELYFHSNDRPGGLGLGDIWVARRSTKDAPWGKPENLGPPVNSADWDYAPSLSSDGLSLYFTSGTRLAVSRRDTKDSAWEAPVYLSPVVNNWECQQGPWISSDGLVLVYADNGNCTPRPGGLGGTDIWLTRRATQEGDWEQPVNVGSPVNTELKESCPMISPDGSTLYFVSTRPGGFGGRDLWQAPILPTCDFNGDGKVDERDLQIMKEHWGENYARCDIGPMPWGDGVVDERDLQVLTPHLVRPLPGATDVRRDIILSWVPVGPVEGHDVYFGTSFEDVTRADRANPLGILVSQRQSGTTYDPEGLLEYGRTYSWRVDEITAPPDSTISNGDVRSFTVEPYGYPVKPVQAMASSVMTSAMGPEKTIDGSGLDAIDQHSVSASHMWLSQKGQSPIWIQYQFDAIYKLHQMWVWNSNQAAESVIGFGAKDVTIETSTDGTTWTALSGLPEFAQASGEPNYVHNTTVDFKGAAARYVRLTINSNWADGAKQAGMAEVRFFYVPAFARDPEPPSGAADLPLGTVLSWRPGRDVAAHRVYFGTDRQAVVSGTAAVNRVTGNSLDPSPLEVGRTYYWRVDEVNEAQTPSVWEGDVWNFSIKEYVTVDDFEQYDDTCHRIFFAWVDGSGHSGSTDCGISPLGGNGTGSTVGNLFPPFAERTVVHGGRQSMPLRYDNTAGAGVAEVVRTFDVSQDWTLGGAKTLVLFLHGDQANGSGEVYMKINGARVAYTGAANPTTVGLWKQWSIDLTSVPSVDLKAIKTLAIGVSGTGKGTLYVDDIRLYRSAPTVSTPADPGTVSLSACYAFEGNANDLSGHGLNGTLCGDPRFWESVPGLGSALSFSGVSDYVDLPIGPLIKTMTNCTLTAWVSFAQGGSWTRIFDFGTGTDRYMFLTPAAGKAGVMRFAITTTSDAGESVVNARSTLPSGWHHVAVVIDGASKILYLYLDGDLLGSATTNTLPRHLGKTTQNWLGRSQWADDDYFQGKLDDFRIYNRALSADEVRYLVGDR